MNKNSKLTIQKTLTLFFICLGTYLNAQSTYDANFGALVFRTSNGRVEHKVGGNNLTNSGSTTLKVYRNVITISNQPIDAVVRVSQYNGVRSFDNFDQPSASGTGYSNNSEDFFSPFFEFNTGGGNVIFNITFILGGTYVSASNIGTVVTLKNVQFNTYDIDGNGQTAGANQFNEFSGFSSSEVASNTNILISYNQNTNLTKFRSNTDQNSSGIQSLQHRLLVKYSHVSTMQINVGAEAAGLAYFFLDFSPGATFTNTVVSLAPTVDLNTSSTGINNEVSMDCNEIHAFTTGSTNIANASSNPSIDEIMVEFDRSLFATNSTDEILIKTGTNTYSAISVHFLNNATLSNVTVSGTTSAIRATVRGNTSRLFFRKSNNNAYTLAEAEAIVDNIMYTKDCNDAPYPDITFSMTARSTSFTSAPVILNIGFIESLPIEFISFEAKKLDKNVELTWQVKEEDNQNVVYEVYRSLDGLNFEAIAQMESLNYNGVNTYRYNDEKMAEGTSFYKIKGTNLINGFVMYSAMRIVSKQENKDVKVILSPNPAHQFINIDYTGYTCETITMSIQDLTGKILYHVTSANTNVQTIALDNIAKGMYIFKIKDDMGQMAVTRFTVLK
jgi:hypothetical protein